MRRLKIGLPVLGDEGGANPPAVASGEIDTAIVWGPSGGYFADQQSVPLAVTPVSAGEDSSLRFSYESRSG